MKRLVSFVIFLLFLIYAPVFGQDTDVLYPVRETHEYDDWDYITNETGLTISAYRGNAKNIEIPEMIHGIKVTALDANLFKSNITIQSVFIPDTVTSIGSYAFHGCTSLEEIRLPNHLTRIESYTFRYCTSLRNITFPESLNVIASYSFTGCINLAWITIPDSVTSIGEAAFDECTSLIDVNMSKELTYLGGNAFRNTPWLADQTDEFVIIGNSILLKWNSMNSIADIPYGVTMIVDAFTDNTFVEIINIPNSVRRIGANSFNGAVNLRQIVIPDTVTTIDGSAFRDCRSLREINIPESVQTISGSAFRGCEKLTGFTFPSKITAINSYVLGDCKSLTDVVIPSTVETIHELAFSGSPYVRLHVTYDSIGEAYAQEHELSYTYYIQQTKDFLYSKNEEGIQILLYIGNLYDVDVPAEIDGLPVNRINTAAFQNNPVARRITLPYTVKSVGDWAFSYMDSLEEVNLSTELLSLGSDAFAGSAKLKNITLPKKLESIGYEPFADIPNLVVYTYSGSYAESYLAEAGYQMDSNTADGLNRFTFSGKSFAPPSAVVRTPTAEEITETPDTAVTTEPATTRTAEPSENESSLITTNTAAATETTDIISVTETPTTGQNTIVETPESPVLDGEKADLMSTVEALKQRNENRTESSSVSVAAATFIPSDTPIPTTTATLVPTDTQMPTATATLVPTDTQMPTETPTQVPTDTQMPTATATLVPTDTQMPTATATQVSTATATQVPTEIPTSTATETPIPTAIPMSTTTELLIAPSIEPIKLLNIQNGVTEITVDMLQNTAEDVTLIIPESVTSIDDDIVKGHKLTIVSSTGTEAERFSRKWDVKFLLYKWFENEADLVPSATIEADQIIIAEQISQEDMQ